jgi:hypothetical protein
MQPTVAFPDLPVPHVMPTFAPFVPPHPHDQVHPPQLTLRAATPEDLNDFYMDDDELPANILDGDPTRHLPAFDCSLMAESVATNLDSGQSGWGTWSGPSVSPMPATPTATASSSRTFLASGSGQHSHSGSESPQSPLSSDTESIARRTNSMMLNTPLHRQVSNRLLATRTTRSSSDSEFSPRSTPLNNRIAALRSSSDSESRSGASTSQSSAPTALTSAGSQSPRSLRKRAEPITDAEKSLSLVRQMMPSMEQYHETKRRRVDLAVLREESKSISAQAQIERDQQAHTLALARLDVEKVKAIGENETKNLALKVRLAELALNMLKLKKGLPLGDGDGADLPLDDGAHLE